MNAKELREVLIGAASFLSLWLHRNTRPHQDEKAEIQTILNALLELAQDIESGDIQLVSKADPELVERVARAMHKAVANRNRSPLTWEAAYPEEQTDFLNVAGTVLAAISTPTPGSSNG